jgi:hypothetical protein
MKHSISFNIFVPFLMTFFSNCTNDYYKTGDPFEIVFRLLDKDGVSATKFNVGDDIIFSILIINRTNNKIILSRSGMNQQDIFRVFGKVYPYLDNTSIIHDYGKPYGVLFCDKSMGAIVPANDTLKLEIPWNSGSLSNLSYKYNSPYFCFLEDQEPLKTGQYWSSFSSAFEYYYDGIKQETDTLKYRVDFEIK